MFKNSNVIITGGTFIETRGAKVNETESQAGMSWAPLLDINNIADNLAGLHALSQEIAHGALHDSSERYPPPRCHPKTRLKVLQILREWIQRPGPKTRVLWLNGAVGVGKSAIMQELASQLYGDDISADFFFGKGHEQRGEAQYLFCTLAYQLAQKVGGQLGELVNAAMKKDPILPTRSMEVQFKELIVKPVLLAAQRGQCITPATVLIDGLDECNGRRNQETILGLLGNAFQETPDFPLQFVIASRPETHIRERFISLPLHSITRNMVLDDSESSHTNEDIKLYLTDGFADILKRKLDLFTSADLPWPSEEVIESLLERASGQFVFAATVLKFVDSNFTHPKTQLEILHECRDGQGLSDLDQLYMQILSTHPNPAMLVRVLGVVVTAFGSPTLSTIDDYLRLQNGTSKVTLEGLASLLRGTGINHDHPSVLHASFIEFLSDKSRSGRFFIDQPRFHKGFLKAWMVVIIKKILFGLASLFCLFWFGFENTFYTYGSYRGQEETWNWLNRSWIAHASLAAPLQTFLLVVGLLLFLCAFFLWIFGRLLWNAIHLMI